MLKKSWGLSIYPEQSDLQTIENYLTMAKKYNFTKIFMSWLHLKDSEKLINHYKQTIQIAKNLGYYVVLDINDESFEFYKTLNIDCLRLDSPILPQTVARLTYLTDFDFQINMSNNDHFIENICDFAPVKENLEGCHNFFPQKHTGLSWKFFEESTKRFKKLGLTTSAFINSQTAQMGPHQGTSDLTTIEELRSLPLKTQAKYLWASKLIDSIYIGNQFATENELKTLQDFDFKRLELDINLVDDLQPLEKEILFEKNHFRRGDINENFIRSTMSRPNFKNREDIIPKNKEDYKYQKGDVIIINKNDEHYQKELIILLEDGLKSKWNEWNLVAKINNNDLDLLGFIKPWIHFKFSYENYKI